MNQPEKINFGTSTENARILSPEELRGAQQDAGHTALTGNVDRETRHMERTGEATPHVTESGGGWTSYSDGTTLCYDEDGIPFYNE